LQHNPSKATGNRYFASSGLAYKFTRDIAIRGELRRDWLTSNTPGVAYNTTSVLLGIALAAVSARWRARTVF
jgi:hypothetical protein